MGEYAKYRGEEIKIGTCEDMYYLRYDQRELVTAINGSIDPVGDAAAIRFRFPFPDEDALEPGQFNDYDRGVAVWGVTVPEGVEHGIVQFVASAGYNVCLPCPEAGNAAHGLTVHRNGFRGPVRIVQQREWEGKLVTVCECGGCEARYRLPSWSDAEPIVVALRSNADARQRESDLYSPQVAFLNTIADRILAGYALELAR